MAVQESRLIISIDAKNAERTAKALNSELQGITNNGNKAVSQTNALGGAMQALAGYMAGVVTVGAAINKMDAYTNLQNRLKLVTNSQQELNKAMNDTFGIAQTTRQEWETVTQVYQRFSDNAKTLGITMEQTAKLTETVSKAVAVSGATAESANAALVQFGQALASGTLRGEELNSVMEQTPELAAAIARGMGLTKGELRAVAAEGKITSAEIVKALEASAASVDDLFQRTDATISQSLTLLSNELTKFIGEAGQSSGAANLLAGSIKLLSENLSLLADAAVIGGIGYITKAILTKTVAVQGAIAASMAQKAADAATLQASIAVADAKIAEAQAHLKNVQATNADAQAKYGATAANLRYKTSVDAVKNAIDEKNALLSTVPKRASLASQALNLVGGPIGAITIGVSALAAGYMYLQSRTAEANAKLEEQGKVANKTKEELLALRGVQLDVAKDDLAASFEAQNEALSKSKEAVDAVLFAIRASSVENERARKITEDARNGVISYTDAIKLLNNEKISVDLYNKLKQQADQYDENSIKAGNTQRALADLKVEVNLAGNASQNAAVQHREQEAALNGVEGAARGATNALSEYTTQALQAGKRAQITDTLLSKGYSLEVARDLADIAAKNGKVTREEAAAIFYKSKQEEALKANIQARSKVESATSKARSSSAKQQAKENKAAVNDAERRAQEQYQLREQIAYEYTDRIGKIEKDLAREIAEIQKANFANPAHTAGYIEAAQGRAMLEKELYIAQLRQQYSEWRATEEQKLDFKVHINELMIQLDSNMTEEMRSDAMQSLKDQANYELAQIQLAKETRIFQAQQAMYSEIGLIQKRYELEQRKIIETAGIADDERRKQLSALNADMKQQEAEKTVSIMMNYKNAIGIDTSADAAFIERQKAINAALESGFIKQKEYEKESLASRQQYDRDMQSSALGSLNTLLSATSSTWSGMTQLVKDGAGEQSSAYKAMFLIQQAFAMTSATINALMAYNQVLASPWTFDPISKQAAANITLGMGMASVGMIAAQTIAGFKSGGYTGNYGTSQVAGVVHGQEYVLNAEATKRVGRGTLDALNNGGTLGGGDEININVILNIGNDGSSTTRVEGQAKEKELASVIANAVRAIIIKEKRQGGLLS